MKNCKAIKNRYATYKAQIIMKQYWITNNNLPSRNASQKVNKIKLRSLRRSQRIKQKLLSNRNYISRDYENYKKVI